MQGYHSTHLSMCCRQIEWYSNLLEKKINAVIRTMSLSRYFNNSHIQRSSAKLSRDLYCINYSTICDL